MVRLRNVLDKYIKNEQMFKIIQYLYPNKKYCFLINIKNKNNNLFSGDEYNLDLKIGGVKYQVNIDEYTDIIYSQTKNNSMENKDEYKKIDIKNIKMIKNPNKKLLILLNLIQ